MAFQILDSELDASLDRIAAKQPVPVSRTAIATAMLKQAADVCERTQNPEAWRLDPAPPIAQPTTAPAVLSPDHQPSTSPIPGDSRGGAATPSSSDAARQSGPAPISCKPHGAPAAGGSATDPAAGVVSAPSDAPALVPPGAGDSFSPLGALDRAPLNPRKPRRKRGGSVSGRDELGQAIDVRA